ncbi:hypothetical protein Tsubulata_048173 [Turnera subulata]|uniref:Helitron helicase-like domain-containing protein n=1 Tax=Turnera subulata TaxID=218843 RepID=A0A9Q0GLF4_9ROSI|nr:hypothetical protein Tsubulata_048173 [Turnera subulata]
MDVVNKLIRMLDETNELVGLFRIARDRLRDNPSASFSLRLVGSRPGDNNQYQQPTIDDIGGLIVGDIGEANSEEDIIIQQHSGALQRITKLHPKYMSLSYPLLFPYGEDRYRPDMKWNASQPGHSRKRSVEEHRCSIKTSMFNHTEYQTIRPND